MPVLHITKGKKAEFLDVTDGPPLGLIESAYSSGTVNIKEGDIFVFYTDGVSEAMNQKGEMYGSDRLIKVVEKNISGSSANILEAAIKDMRHFEPRHIQHDDITLIMVKYTNKKEA